MSNINDYILENGHRSFKDLPFNEIDALVFSQLVYINFNKTVGDFRSDVRVSLREVCQLYYELHSEEDIQAEITIVAKAIALLKECAISNRYSNVKMLKYVNNVDDEIDKQFSAINFYLDDETVVIAYKGTDTSITGIKESAMLSYMFPVPAQIEALYYLQETALRSHRRIILCGHSKGGNLATYAAVSCSNSLKKKIDAVYEFDAPGFPKQMIERYDYEQLKSRIYSFIPQRSIIGRMLYHNSSLMVVKSNNENLKQHQVSSWEIVDNHFVSESQTDEVSQFIDKYLKEFSDNTGETDMEGFLDALFSTLESAGINSIDDLKKFDFSKILKTFSSFSDVDEAHKQSFEKTFKQAIVDFSKLMYADKISTIPFVQGFIEQKKTEQDTKNNKKALN